MQSPATVTVNKKHICLNFKKFAEEQKVWTDAASDVGLLRQKRSDSMADDFSALELDIDQDEELSALFGRSPEPVTSTKHNKLTSTHAKPVELTNSGVNIPPAFHQHSKLQDQTQSLLCITNKRPAAALNQSWPNKARQPIPPANIVDVNTSYDDLELESWEPDRAETRQASSGTNRQNNSSVSSAAAPTVFRPVPAGITLQTNSNTDSQATELWQSVYSRPLQASQASVSVQRASTSQRTAQGHWSGAAHAAPVTCRHLSTSCHQPDITAAMVCTCQQTLHTDIPPKAHAAEHISKNVWAQSLCM